MNLDDLLHCNSQLREYPKKEIEEGTRGCQRCDRRGKILHARYNGGEMRVGHPDWYDVIDCPECKGAGLLKIEGGFE